LNYKIVQNQLTHLRAPTISGVHLHVIDKKLGRRDI
jgi:hypothetical protein